METERSRLLEKTIKTFDSIESGSGITPAVDESYTTFGAPSRYNSASTKEKLWKNNREEYLKNENDKELGRSPTNCNTLTCFLVVLCLILPFLGLYLVHSFKQTLDTFDSTTLLPNGAKVQLFSPSSNLYLRVDTGESSTQASVTERKSSKLVADIPFPWLHGSSFEVFRSNNHCFQLKSMKNFWLRVDSVTGELMADGSTWFDGEHFALQPMQENQLTGDSRIYYQLKVCNYQYYFGSYRTKPGSFAIKLTPDSMSRRKSDWFPWARQSFNSSNSKGFHTALEVKIVKPWLGVNLGGWFIPEYWMNPTFFNASGLQWASSVCTFKTKNAKLAEKTMTKHLATWITETDLRQIVKLGFNSIRLPVGYWNLIDDPYDRYVPSNVNVSLHYLDWLFDITDELKLSVLVDLHGGPGSQNGADHSGCLYIQQFNQPKNIELTLQSIEIIMKRYSKRSSFLGVELLNEPSDNFIIKPSYSTLLNDYYIKAYHLIRSYHKSCYIMINELSEKQYKIYQNDLQEPNYYNVIMDYHLYNWQNPYTYQTAEQHLTNAKNWKQLIDYFNKQHPIVVGEWSMSTGVVRQVGQKFVDASAESFTKSFGWYLWSWKTERNPQFDAWDVQYQMITLGGFKGGSGLNPLKYYQEHAKYLLSN